MPRKNISDMLHRSVAGAVLFSICHFAAAEAANTKPEKFNFWELEDLTWWTEESTDEEIDEFLLAFSEGRPALTNMEWNIADRLIEDASTALPKLQYGFINTAGRLHIDEALMNELIEVKKAVQPTEILLVVDAMTGQDAVNVAKSFDEQLDITGVILTKLDGDTRGGAALSIRAVTGKPIKFCGVGEKMGDLEPFYPDRMASRILGMGDVLTLIEKAKAAVSEEQLKDMEKRMLQAKFTLDDFLVQFESIKKMGGVKDVIGMMPGMSGMKIKEGDINEDLIDKYKAIICSMTKRERDNPDIIKSSRRKRIAAGSGTTIQQVNQLLKQYDQAKAMMKSMKNNKKFRMPF